MVRARAGEALELVRYRVQGVASSAGNGKSEKEQHASGQPLILLPENFSRPHAEKSEVILEY